MANCNHETTVDSVDAFIERLQDGWRPDSPAELAGFVPHETGPQRRSVLVALIAIDQEHQWSSGMQRLIEDYLDTWTELRDDPQAVKDLLEAECRTRLSCGEVPTIGELRQRFGDVAAQIDLDGLFEDERQERRLAEPGGNAAAAVSGTGTADHDPPVSPGYLFGDYVVRRLIRQGGMALVYEAEDQGLKRSVAVKVPRRRWQASVEARELFLKEGRAAATLRHPGIVTIHFAGQQADGTCFLVFEYIEGQALDELMAAGGVTATQAAEWAAQVAEALHYAHPRGFVHRDLKPGNILIDAEGKTHLADFGLAVHESDQRQRAGESSGTLAYMPPEQVRGEVQWQDGRSDIWSLGVTLFEMLTRRRPFCGDTPEELRAEILNRDPKPPTEIDDTIPEELERICLKCLSKSKTDRYPNAAALARNLRHWQHPRRRSSGPILAALAVLLGAMCLLWVVWPRGKPPPVPLEGEIALTIWNEQLANRKRLPLDSAGALPLQAGDQVRLEATVTSDAYVYVIWIDAQGHVFPMYPWVKGDWSKRRDPEVPVKTVSLPDVADEGFPIQGPPGTETLILLARQTPLPKDVNVETLLDDLPDLKTAADDSPVWFADGRLIERGEPFRGPDVKSQRINDPLLQAQRKIQEKLGKHFLLNRTVCFANQVEEQAP